MDKVIAVIFNNEANAYEGYKGLKELDAEGTISLYATAVVKKDINGKVCIEKTDEQEAVNTIAGFLIGGLIGLLGGPVGVALGASAGTLGGMLYDLSDVEIDMNFLNEVGKDLQSGKVAVLAEAREEWVTPVDTRMEALGGVVLRRPVEEALIFLFEKEAAARKAEITTLEAEYNQASRETKDKLQTKINAVKDRLKNMQDRAKKVFETTNRRIDAKVKQMEEQITKVPEQMKDKIRGRIINAKSEYNERGKKLKQAWELIKEAV